MVKRICDGNENGCSDVGIQEALEAGEKLEHIPIDCIFCSDMDRARSTVSLAMSVHSSRRTPVCGRFVCSI